MVEYRAYFVDDDEHFMKVMTLTCADDAAAIRAAKAHLGGYNNEV